MPFYESFSLHTCSVAGGSPQDLTVPAAPINVFVGPNGAGKSTAVQELFGHRPPKIACRRVLTPAAIEGIVASIPSNEINARLAADYRAGKFFAGEPPRTIRFSLGASSHITQGEARERLILSVSDSIGHLRLGPRALMRAKPASRLDALWRDARAFEFFEKQVSTLFGVHPVIDTSRGSHELRFSRVPPPDGIGQRIGLENEEFMDLTETVDSMSNGTKTYIGLWAHILSGSERLIFLDEAGAFLHAPLARRLGKQLSELAVARDGHVFAATHCPDFVLGCVQAGCRANVIRLTHRHGVSTARLLSEEALLPMMRDPLMRSANLLSGLFHDGAVVCEADSDRAFYQEINERLIADDEGIESCHFINAQNWQTVPRISGALRSLGIPAAILVDLDAVIADQTKVLFEAAGIPPITSRGLGQVRGELTPRKEDRARLKNEGLSAVPSDQRESWEKYLRDLEEYGIFAVPVGELEGWFAELNLPRSKNIWITEVFRRMGSDPLDPTYKRPTGDGPWAYLRRIAAWINNPQRRGMPEAPSDGLCTF